VISVGCIALAVVAGFAGSAVLGSLQMGVVIGLALTGAVSMTKFIVSILLKRTGNWMDRTLSVVSMSGICFIIAIITARSREDLLTVGAALLAAVLIHNFIGYTLGYWLSRAVKLDEKTCRTVAFEVGMQNGGMASGLAMRVLESSSAALAPAIFGPWMNISGSILATWWHRKPIAEKSENRSQTTETENDE
jgi:BASS family bile acid:Na+ symporter